MKKFKVWGVNMWGYSAPYILIEAGDEAEAIKIWKQVSRLSVFTSWGVRCKSIGRA